MKEDALPEPPSTYEAKSSHGSLYQLGKHLLLCGDATKSFDLDKLMPFGRVDMLFTDPPYGTSHSSGVFHSERRNKNHGKRDLVSDTGKDVYTRFVPLITKYIDGPCYVWFSTASSSELLGAVQKAEAQLHTIIVWDKTDATKEKMSGDYQECHELCAYFNARGRTSRWQGSKDAQTIWGIEGGFKGTWHSVQKPVALAERAISNHKVEVVLDCFAGSGSTLIAAEKMGKTCWACEIDPVYVDVIRKRYVEFIGGDKRNWEEETPALCEEVNEND